MTLLLHLADFNERRWAEGFAAALPGRKVVTRADSYDPDEVEYIFIWKPKPDAFEGLHKLKAILSLGAGGDALVRNPTRPPDGPSYWGWGAALVAQVAGRSLPGGLRPLVARYSHSIVPGGLDVTSSVTRLISLTSFVIRVEIFSSTSYGRRAQSAVIASSEVTGRRTTGWP